MSERLLGLVVGAGGGIDSRLCAELAEPARDRGIRLAVTLTPTAHHWLASVGELDRLAALTDLPVRSAGRTPGEPRPHPDPAVFLFAPATANSLAKLACGIADNQALTVLGQAVGDPAVTVLIRPQADDAQRGHPAFATNLAILRDAGVLVSDAPWTDPWTPLLDEVAAAAGWTAP